MNLAQAVSCLMTGQHRGDVALALHLQVSTGDITRIGAARMYAGVSASPDGRFLLAAWMERPFSFNVPCGRFPKRLQLWDRCVWHVSCGAPGHAAQPCPSSAHGLALKTLGTLQ